MKTIILTKTLEVKDYFLKFKKLIFALCCFAFFSCGETTKGDDLRKVSIPKDIVKQDEMVLIMTDMHIAESMLNRGIAEGDSAYTPDAVYNGIYAKHNVTKEDYNRSVKFYSSNPSVNQKLYTEVIDALNELNAHYEKEEKKKTNTNN